MPLAIDLYGGLGGWAEGFLAEGYDVIGFDIERHDYGTGGYPGQLVLQDVLTLHGSQFRNAAVIVASPPCQEYSYMAMPWSRAKAKAREIREDTTGEKLRKLNALFDACFRIQREASEAAGQHIPMVVENVKGAQPWVGRAAWHYGSYYLWGDVPALMPPIGAQKFSPDGTCHPRGSWFKIADSKNRGSGSWFGIGSPGQKQTLGNPVNGIKQHGSWRVWFDIGLTKFPSQSARRKAASAQIAKIPFPLASWIARAYKPVIQELPTEERIAVYAG